MTKLYKLTDENGRSYGNTQWGDGVEHTASGKGELCGPGWLHAYTDSLLAVFLNPIHANLATPQLWECEGEIGKEDNGLKVGCTKLKTIKRMELPVVSTAQRIAFGILCAKEVCKTPEWNKWADGWLDGTNRTNAAYNAAYDAAYAAYDAAYAAAYAAYDAAYAAAYAACDAAYAASYDACDAAYDAAYAAAKAAASTKIDLIAIANRALGVS